jgi:hypothetical protein
VVLALTLAVAQPSCAGYAVERIAISAEATEAFDPQDTSLKRFGKLMFRGSLVLSCKDREFGGLSVLRVEADGQHFISLSDRGQWLRGRIVYRDKAPVAIANAEMAPMLGPDGRPLSKRGGTTTPRRGE